MARNDWIHSDKGITYDSHNFNDNTLACPHPDHYTTTGDLRGYTHLTKVITQACGRDDDVRVLSLDGTPDQVGGYPFEVSEDRESVALVGYCEGGHEFTISFVQHEGNTEVTSYSRDWLGTYRP